MQSPEQVDEPALAAEPVPTRSYVPVIAWAVVGVLVIAATISALAFNGLLGGKLRRTATGGSQPSATTPAPDGAIPAAELNNATLDIPAWPAGSLGCPTTAQRFTDGTAAPSPEGHVMQLRKIVYADVDHDGANETVVLIACVVQGASHQVAVFDRDASGKILTLGQVVGQTGDVRNMFDIDAESNGSVKVEVGDLNGCCGFDQTLPQHQWRTYSWDGQGFKQTAGPTSFPPNPRTADLAISSGDLMLGAPSGGLRKGTITVTVKNNGPKSVGPLSLVFDVPSTLMADGAATNACTRTTGRADNVLLTCSADPPAPGQSRDYPFGFATSAMPTKGSMRVFASDQSLKAVHDTKTDNNEVTFAIKTS